MECGLCYSSDPVGEEGHDDPVEESTSNREVGSSCTELSLEEGSVCSSEENWTRNPEFSDMGSFGLGDGQSCAVRTADWRLAELGQKALDRGLLSPLEEPTQVCCQLASISCVYADILLSQSPALT